MGVRWRTRGRLKMIGRRRGVRKIGMGRKERILFSKDDSCYITRACTCVYIQDHIRCLVRNTGYTCMGGYVNMSAQHAKCRSLDM